MNRSEDVDTWLSAYDSPQKDLVAAIRHIILQSDPRVSECIKWQAPTFVYKGNIASFFPKAKKHASLMFHKGAHIPGEWPALEGDAAEARTLKVLDTDDLAQKQSQLEGIIRAWSDLQDG